MTEPTALTRLEAGMPILFGGDQIVHVPADLAERYRAGDRLLVVQESGDLLLIPREQQEIASAAVGRAHAAFAEMGRVDDAQITRFYEEFALRLEDEAIWSRIAAANGCDVASAGARGRSTTRLVAGATMRRDMVDGLRQWGSAATLRGRVLETVRRDGLTVEQVAAGLGVIGFVFEGRPNVFADATGVLRNGNTVVFRIGSDALGTARAIMACALAPALAAAELPEGAASLVESPEHAAGWAMFADKRLALAVARGSGPAVAQLGSVARQYGVPVSLHGTGGAWIVADTTAGVDEFAAAVYNSLDRKTCNTLNVCCIPRQRAAELTPRLLDALHRAGKRRGHNCKLHVVEGDAAHVPAAWFDTTVAVRRAEGDMIEPMAELLPVTELGHEWEWEETPEVTLKLVNSVEEAVSLFNRWSPHFVASLITTDPERRRRFFDLVDAPFVGNGMTRWVDGQYALQRPELGLSNWEHGRLFVRGGVLSGDGVYTVRTRATQDGPDLTRWPVLAPP